MSKRVRKSIGVPILKLPPHYLLEVLNALSLHEYDRDGFKEAVLDLFPDKEEKSVFRGMAVPTLRTLGLMLGFDQEIRLSTDGAIAVQASKDRGSVQYNPIQRVLLEMEFERSLHRIWINKNIQVSAILDLYGRIEANSEQQDSTKDVNQNNNMHVASDLLGKTKRWLKYLEFFGILKNNGEIVERKVSVCANTSSYSEKEKKQFASYFLKAYSQLRCGGVGEPVIAIEDLRRAVGIGVWTESKKLIMHRDFDRLLTLCLESCDLTIHLHRSMGADEELFVYRGTAFQSVSLSR